MHLHFNNNFIDYQGGRSQDMPGNPDEQVPDIYHFSRLWRTSEVFLPLTNELYQHTKGYSKCSCQMILIYVTSLCSGYVAIDGLYHAVVDRLHGQHPFFCSLVNIDRLCIHSAKCA